MANTLTNLIPDAYAALNVISRELVGMIPAVMRDATVERAAVGQVVRSPVVPAIPATDITPAVTPPNDGDMTIGNRSFSITKARRAPFRWNGEEQRGLNNGGPGVLTIQQDQIAQALRTLTNEIESDLCGLHTQFSRATGAAGTNPFATTHGITADLKKILDDNGAPDFDRHLIFNTTAGAAIRKLSNLFKVNESGTRDILTQGKLIDLNNFALRESAQVKTSVAGTAASATVNNAGYAVGATVLTLSSAGTGTLVAGDCVTFAGDTNIYVLESGDTDVSNGGTITLAAPGLLVAMSTATKAITVIAAAARNMAFRRSALLLAHRLPALPDGVDMAHDRTTITDPVSGLSFEIAEYRQYRQVQWEVSCAWGVGVTKPEHTAIMLG